MWKEKQTFTLLAFLLFLLQWLNWMWLFLLRIETAAKCFISPYSTASITAMFSVKHCPFDTSHDSFTLWVERKTSPGIFSCRKTNGVPFIQALEENRFFVASTTQVLDILFLKTAYYNRLLWGKNALKTLLSIYQL